MQAPIEKIVVLGTGGTIAGLGESGAPDDRYVAGQIDIHRIMASMGREDAQHWAARVQAEQVFQTDSKDMDWPMLRQLGVRCEQLLARSDVAGIVITHGTDTMEETAYLLHRCLPWQEAGKPVVLTGAMRPASSQHPDGPVNLAQALTLAAQPQAPGVWVAFAGDVHHALSVQKTDPTALHAFSSGDAPACARFDGHALHWREGQPAARQPTAGLVRPWQHEALPRVEIVTSHSAASGQIVRDMLATHGEPLRGLVLAGTGNGTVHTQLEEAIECAVDRGVRVVRASRCAFGRVLTSWSNRFEGLPDLDAHRLTPAKARWALILALLDSATSHL
jgi:L-asparaginase